MHARRDLPPVLTRARRTTLPGPRKGLAGADAEVARPLWPSDPAREAATVRSRIADRLVQTVELSPEHLPPGETPELGGECVTVPGDGIASAPLSLRFVFAGVAWHCMHVGTEWTWDADPLPSLVYEIRPRR